MKYKAKIRIPKDQYAFIELEHEGTVDEIEAIYNSFTGKQDQFASLFDRDFNKTLDKYLKTQKLAAEDYENCTFAQKHVIQCLKRAFKRISE